MQSRNGLLGRDLMAGMAFGAAVGALSGSFIPGVGSFTGALFGVLMGLLGGYLVWLGTDDSSASDGSTSSDRVAKRP
jgi:uncharacterized membrane protein YfcA